MKLLFWTGIFEILAKTLPPPNSESSLSIHLPLILDRKRIRGIWAVHWGSPSIFDYKPLGQIVHLSSQTMVVMVTATFRFSSLSNKLKCCMFHKWSLTIDILLKSEWQFVTEISVLTHWYLCFLYSKGKGIWFIVLYPPKHLHDLPPLAGLYTRKPFQSPGGYSRANGSI